MKFVFSNDRSEYRWECTMVPVWSRSGTSTGDLGCGKQGLFRQKKIAEGAKEDSTGRRYRRWMGRNQYQWSSSSHYLPPKDP